VVEGCGRDGDWGVGSYVKADMDSKHMPSLKKKLVYRRLDRSLWGFRVIWYTCSGVVDVCMPVQSRRTRYSFCTSSIYIPGFGKIILQYRIPDSRFEASPVVYRYSEG
jgi:hypothetical protein